MFVVSHGAQRSGVLTALHFVSCPTTSHQHVAGRSPEPLIAKNTELHERRKHLSCHSWRLYHTLPTARNCVTGSESQAMLDVLQSQPLGSRCTLVRNRSAPRKTQHSPARRLPKQKRGPPAQKEPTDPRLASVSHLPSAISYWPSAISQQPVIFAALPPCADISPPALRPQSRSPLRRRH